MLSVKKYIIILIVGIFLGVFAIYSTYLSIVGEENFWSVLKRYNKENIYQTSGKWMDHKGEYTTLLDYQGTKTIICAVYLECTVSCPLIIQKLKLLEQNPALKSGPYKFLVILLEDVRDKPEILQNYRRRYSIDNDRWVLLTSDSQTLNNLTGSYGIYYEESGSLNFQYTHTNFIAFVGSDGKIKREIRNISRFNPQKIADWMKNDFL